MNTYTTSAQVGPSAAFGPSGGFVVVWSSQGQDGSSTGVFGQRYDGSGIPLGPEFQINSYTTEAQTEASVASGAAGNFVVVWRSPADGSAFGVFGQRYASSGAPLGSEFRVNTYTYGFQEFSAVAADPVGNFVVVWQGTSDEALADVFAQRYASSGAPLGPEFRVNSYTTSPQGSPAVAYAPTGEFVVVWQGDGQGDPAVGVFGQRYGAGGTPLGPEFRVNTYTPGSQGFPSVSCDSSGNFVVVWYSGAQDGSDMGVFGQGFAASGAPIGPEFQVNTSTTGYQGFPAVASDPTGNFVVVWHGDQDGSSYGVFGQRYGRIVPVELMRFGVE